MGHLIMTMKREMFGSNLGLVSGTLLTATQRLSIEVTILTHPMADYRLGISFLDYFIEGLVVTAYNPHNMPLQSSHLFNTSLWLQGREYILA